MNVELSRQQWESGRRRLDATRRDPAQHAWLNRQFDVVSSELRRRLGQTFTLDQLIATYARADDWALAALQAARGEDDPTPEMALVTDAAFHDFARRASDYRP